MSTPLGDLIRNKRKAKGWTQEQLGAKLRVQQVTVSTWETGESQPRDITAVMKVLGITNEEATKALHALVQGDDVIVALANTQRITAEDRNALLTLYRTAVKAHRTNEN